MNYAQVLAGELRGAFDRQDHPAFTRLLARMVAAISYTGPGSIAPHNDERVETFSSTRPNVLSLPSNETFDETVLRVLRAGPPGEVVYESGGTTIVRTSTADLMKGTPNCGRHDGCQCTTWPQAKTCMHRR